MNPDTFSTNNNPIPEDVMEDQRIREAKAANDRAALRRVLAERFAARDLGEEDQRTREPKEREALRRAIAERSAERDLGKEAEDLAEDIRRRAREAAETAVKGRVTVSVTPRGRVRRNGPCPCGSGRKFKSCCLREVQDPESEKKLPSPGALRAYLSNSKGTQ
jgi:preprotein translocase subunit SecA